MEDRAGILVNGRSKGRPMLRSLACTVLLSGSPAMDYRTLAVLVDNVAEVSSSTLERARGEAANVFRQAGIQIRWLECSFAEAEYRDPPGCQLALDVPTIIVKILSRAEVERWPVPGNSLGFARGTHVYVLFPRVEALAPFSSSVPVILGHALAHEIGHSLLGNEHSADGIMRAGLRRRDWKRAEKGQLLFTRKEAVKLRHFNASGPVNASWLRNGAISS
jgi:hypothetical protein